MHDCDVDRFIILTVCTLGFISPCGNKQAGHRIYWTQRNRFSCWTSSFAVQHTAVMSIKHTDVCSQQRLRYDLKKKKKANMSKSTKRSISFACKWSLACFWQREGIAVTVVLSSFSHCASVKTSPFEFYPSMPCASWPGNNAHVVFKTG